jgi:hypothetical protein
LRCGGRGGGWLVAARCIGGWVDLFSMVKGPVIHLSVRVAVKPWGCCVHILVPTVQYRGLGVKYGSIEEWPIQKFCSVTPDMITLPSVDYKITTVIAYQANGNKLIGVIHKLLLSLGSLV